MYRGVSEAGIQQHAGMILDSRFRGNDEIGRVERWSRIQIWIPSGEVPG